MFNNYLLFMFIDYIILYFEHELLFLKYYKKK
jgi:hypothetical protein